jgi:hypothetical protein
LIVGVGESARQAVRAVRPRCAGPSGFLAVLAFRGVSLELASLKQSRALIRERLRSSAAHRGSPGPHRLPGLVWRNRCARRKKAHNDRVHVGGRQACGRLSGCGEHRSERRIRAARV